MIDWLYDAAKFSLSILFRLWRMRVFGAENVPRTGPVIVACNHISYFDPPLRLPGDRKASREELANFTDQVMQAIRKLPETIRGD